MVPQPERPPVALWPQGKLLAVPEQQLAGSVELSAVAALQEDRLLVVWLVA